ncbi:DUF3047 domain-containing protein [Thauera sp. CAU 1555]|uniref:DUF3047 domain-containing protein n=1 Tax=Thauera sedimentorum TaxID=2767595 RepID=A0ABR9B9R7_9RHOO|nr:DUF3047 domain-containing protein [Thauera sedimentorum]MBC9071258.1 DUF3047 domain-containing protein [Thauera sedimentorum]MBD8502177.1 DUF3047 domain-containing protein [Thauera sedimentorum]
MNGRGLIGAILLVLSATALAQAPPAVIAPFSLAAPGATPPAPWQHQPLPKVERENRFTLVEDTPGGRAQTVLRIDSEAAASTLAHPLSVDPGERPWLSWRWKVSAPVAGSDFRRKEGDDYAARVYVLFDYPVERLSFGERAAIALARVLHGAELPTAALAYVWGTAQAAGAIGPNPYTDRVRMVVVDSGAVRAGQWVGVRRNVAEDFRAAFGEEAPPITGIAVAADTDNTGEAVTAWFEDLRLEAAR